MHAAAAQTAAAQRPLILAAAACIIRPGESPALSLNSRRAQYRTPSQAGFASMKYFAAPFSFSDGAVQRPGVHCLRSAESAALRMGMMGTYDRQRQAISFAK